MNGVRCHQCEQPAVWQEQVYVPIIRLDRRGVLTRSTQRVWRDAEVYCDLHTGMR